MYHYLLYPPVKLDKSEKYPLIVYLHGAPQRGNDLRLVQNEAIPLFIEKKKLSLQMFVVAPQCPINQSWDYLKVYNLIKDLSTKHNIDITRIYITGFSMGGYGSLVFIKHFSNIVAAAIPVCSGGSIFLAEYLNRTPIWFFHGTEDKIIEFKHTKELYDKLVELKADVRLTAIEGKGHEIWNEVYEKKEIYDWLLNYRTQIHML